MNCPVDGATLALTSRSSIEIDYCPECRGVWLDRGELDKIIERDSQAYSKQDIPKPMADAPRERYSERDNRSHTDDSYRKSPHKKRESFLGDLFDF